MYCGFLKLSEHCQLYTVTKDISSHFTVPKFWMKRWRFATTSLALLITCMTTIPFIGIFIVHIHTDKMTEMWFQKQKFVSTPRLINMERSAHDILFEFWVSPLRDLVILSSQTWLQKHEYRSCLKWNKLNHCRKRMVMAFFFFFF